MDVLIILLKNNSDISSGVGRTSKKSTAAAVKPTMTLEEISRDANREKTKRLQVFAKAGNLGICNKGAKTQKGGGLYHLSSAIDMQIFKMETEKKSERT